MEQFSMLDWRNGTYVLVAYAFSEWATVISKSGWADLRLIDSSSYVVPIIYHGNLFLQTLISFNFQWHLRPFQPNFSNIPFGSSWARNPKTRHQNSTVTRFKSRDKVNDPRIELICDRPVLHYLKSDSRRASEDHSVVWLLRNRSWGFQGYYGILWRH